MSTNNLIKNAILMLVITIILTLTYSTANSKFAKPQSTDCYNCHRKHYEGTTTPNHTANNFPTKCDTCHRAAAGAWRPASAFNHAGITSGCYDCHKAKYDSTTNPNHAASSFPTTCEQCHKSTNSWKPASFSHTKFPLVGAHVALQCTSCHKGGQYTGLSGECYSCHKAKYDSTTNPNHANAGYSTDCTLCHSASASTWKGAKFSHTKFPLTGKHIGVECSKCHLNNQYTGTSKECSSCHKARYDATTSPRHSTIGLGTTCEQCHNTSNWKPANWNHSNAPASWSLTGLHTTLTCTICHTNSQQLSSRECYSCHKARYDATTNPNHATSGFPTTCEQCHNSTAWRPATFSHTKYPLTGRHLGVECSRCHLNNQYIGTPNDCYSCHWTRNQKDPWKLRLGQTCQQCHNTSAWKPANWSHSSPPASWALTGKHAATVCITCHTNYKTITSRECYSCHRASYDATINPNHRASGFPTTCEQCHSSTAWRPATFSHTRYPLTGRHTTVECARCHLNNQYAGTPRDCYTCHWTRNQKDPWRLRLGQTCEQCHNTSAWKPANWSHSSAPASYALTGRHSAIVCTACHVNYQAVASRTCYSCHKAKYDASTNPKHSTARIGTVCENCHNTSAWTPGKFNHATDGKGAISSRMSNAKCNNCHPNNNDYTRNATRCLGCHKKEHYQDPCAQCHYTVAPWDKTR
ncbi:MAG: hypothetical protein AABY39_08075 [Nitrospirota bacterium]